MTLPPVPPFTAMTAARKVRIAEDIWNTRDPAAVANTCTADCHWRGRSYFAQGRAGIVSILAQKWRRELEYRLIKEVWAFRENRIAVRFVYEWCDSDGQWFRSYGNENWEFDNQGLVCRRAASCNDAPIQANERKYDWPIGPRPFDYPSLSNLGL